MAIQQPANPLLFGRDYQVRVDTLDVSNLDLEFKVLRTIKKEPNKCSLTVWNLTEDHRAYLLKKNQPIPGGKTKPVNVHISAGYFGNTTGIFTGDLDEVGSARENTDWKTVIAGSDGGVTYRQSRISKQFAAGAQWKTIARECLKSFNGVNSLDSFNRQWDRAIVDSNKCSRYTEVVPHATVVCGSAPAEFDRILKNAGLTWSMQNGVVVVVAKGKPVEQPAVLVSPSTGLLDSPESAVDAKVSLGSPQQYAPGATPKQRKNKPQDPSILRLRTLIIPGIEPGRKIDLQSQLFSGGYYLTEVEYIGQTFSNTWECRCIARIY